MRAAALVVLGVITSPAVALAQPSLTPSAPEPAPEPAPAFGTDADVLADRVFAAPTALTQPEGSIAVTGVQLGPVSTALVTAGVTERVHIQAGVVRLLGEDEGLLGAMGKVRLVDDGRLQLAMQGGFWRVADDYDALTVLHGGFALTLCLDRACRSLVSGFAGSAAAIGEDGHPLLVSAAAMLGVSAHVKLVGELDHGFADGDEGNLLWLGVRFTGRTMGLDLGAFAVPDEEVVVPTLSLTYRGG